MRLINKTVIFISILTLGTCLFVNLMAGEKELTVPAGAVEILDFQMEEGEGRVLKDSSAFHNDATAFAMPYDNVFKWLPRKAGGHSLSIGNDLGSDSSTVGTFIPYSASLQAQKFIIDFDIKPNSVYDGRLLPIMSAEVSFFHYNKFKTLKCAPFYPFRITLAKGNYIQLALAIRRKNGKITQFNFRSKQAVPVGRFTNVRFVYDSNGLKCFLDGQLAIKKAYLAEIVYDHPDFYPGHVVYQFGCGSFDGELDNVKIYDLDMAAKKAKFDVTISTDKYLNFFAPEEEHKFSVGVSNFSENESQGVLSWSVMDHRDKKIASGEENVALKPLSKNLFDITVPFEKRGCFWLKCVYRDENGASSEREEQYAVGAIRNIKNYPDSSPFGTDGMEMFGYRNRMPDLGAKWNRMWIGWNTIEPKEGQLEWEAADRAINYYHKQGKKIMICLFGTPLWAVNKKGKDALAKTSKVHTIEKYPAADLERRGEFVEKMVNRYKDQVDVWEVWNEANCQYWSGTPEEYMPMLKQTHEIVRRLDPTAKLAGPSNYCGGWNKFSEAILKMGAGKYFDLFVVHYLGGGGGRILPENAEKIIQNTKDMLRAYKAVMPIWNGETGFYTATRDPATNRPITPEKLAEKLRAKEKYLCNKRGHGGFERCRDEYTVSAANIRKMVICLANGVNKSFFHTVGLMKYESDFSWLLFRKGSGVVLPAISWTAMVEKLNNVDFIRRIDLDNSDYYGYLFKNRSDKRNVAVFWSSKGEGDVTLRNSSSSEGDSGILNTLSLGLLGSSQSEIKQFNLWGNPVELNQNDDGSFKLSLTGAPVYLEGVSDNIKLVPPLLTISSPGFVSQNQKASIKVSVRNPFKDALSGTVKIKPLLGVEITPSEFKVNIEPGKKLMREISLIISSEKVKGSIKSDFMFDSKKRLEKKSVIIAVKKAPFKCLKKTGEIVIDGRGDDQGWLNLPAMTLSDEKQVVIGLPSSYFDKQTIIKDKEWYGPEDLNAKAFVCWDAKNLYLLIKVNDDFMRVVDRDTRPYRGDGVEVFIDTRPKNKQTEKGYSSGVCHLSLTPGDKANTKATCLWNGKTSKHMKGWGIKLVSTQNSEGYIIEAKIPLRKWIFPDLNLKNGRVIGFDIAINDADHKGKRKSQIVWRGTKKNFSDASNFGKIVIDEIKK